MENFESPRAERFLTFDQVTEKFRELAGVHLPEDANANIERHLSDENGPYLMELHHVEGDGRITELSYQRAGVFPGADGKMLRSLKTRIDIAYYDPDGGPEGGHPIAELDEATGEWRDL